MGVHAAGNVFALAVLAAAAAGGACSPKMRDLNLVNHSSGYVLVQMPGEDSSQSTRYHLPPGASVRHKGRFGRAWVFKSSAEGWPLTEDLERSLHTARVVHPRGEPREVYDRGESVAVRLAVP